MASALLHPKEKSSPFLARVLEYARETGIDFKKVNRHITWQRYGLPDVRGFTPHLRRVNVSTDSHFQIKELLESAGDLKKFRAENILWLIHDVLHVIFYDFATLNLGIESWSDKNRFIESHLASEAFAVLALDYHFLIHTDIKGLAIQLSSSDWGKFHKINKKLPDFESFEFCQTLVKLYLCGQTTNLNRSLDKNPTPATRSYDDWLGHELRYSSKQRHYILSWWEDLNGKKISKKSATIENTEVAFPLWELIQIFCYAEESSWKKFLVEMTSANLNENVFSKLSKYKNKMTTVDFRFTDVEGLPKKEVLAHLFNAKKPNSSDLFLMWQIISLKSPQVMSSKDRSYVQQLALATSGKNVPINLWLEVQRMTLGICEKINWEVQREKRSTFFLP